MLIVVYGLDNDPYNDTHVTQLLTVSKMAYSVVKEVQWFKVTNVSMQPMQQTHIEKSLSPRVDGNVTFHTNVSESRGNKLTVSSMHKSSGALQTLYLVTAAFADIAACKHFLFLFQEVSPTSETLSVLLSQHISDQGTARAEPKVSVRISSTSSCWFLRFALDHCPLIEASLFSFLFSVS